MPIVNLNMQLNIFAKKKMPQRKVMILVDFL